MMPMIFFRLLSGDEQTLLCRLQATDESDTRGEGLLFFRDMDVGSPLHEFHALDRICGSTITEPVRTGAPCRVRLEAPAGDAEYALRSVDGVVELEMFPRYWVHLRQASIATLLPWHLKQPLLASIAKQALR